MNVAVVGLGYVGCVACAKLCEAGHHVVGVDINALKVRQISQGQPTVAEPGLRVLLRSALDKGRLRAVSNVGEVIDWAEVFYICVGTPNNAEGDLDLSALYRVVDEIRYQHNSGQRKTLLLRSTIKPGTCRTIVQLVKGSSLSVVSNPEFLREGQAVTDWDEPGMIVIGAFDDHGKEASASLYAGINAQIRFVAPESAELIKYVNNSWHALKVAFGNEVGRIAVRQGVSIAEVMELFVSDTKLNISDKYLRPGMPYGGSCLTKDLKGFRFLAQEMKVDVPVLTAVEQSNADHISYHLEQILQTKSERIGFYGLAFKPGSDDLRASPALLMLRELRAEGRTLWAYDQVLSRLSEDEMRNNHVASREPWLQGLLKPDLEVFARDVDLVVFVHPPDKEDREFLNLLGKQAYVAYAL